MPLDISGGAGSMQEKDKAKELVELARYYFIFSWSTVGIKSLKKVNTIP